MGKTHLPDGFGDRLRRIEAQLAQLAKASGITSAVVSKGGITVTDGGGVTIEGGGGVTINDGGDVTINDGGELVITGGGDVYVRDPNSGTDIALFGAFTVASDPVTGLILRRPDGSLMMWGYGDADGNGFWALADKGGRIVVSDDGQSGQGLARPYIPSNGFYSQQVPSDSTTSSSFTTLQQCHYRKQHPQFAARVLADVTSTTAEYRFMVSSGPDAGTQIGSTVTVNNGFGYNDTTAAPIPGGHMANFTIDFQARVASGTGQISAAVVRAEGVQS